MQVVADYQKQKEDVLRRIQEWQHNHAAKEGKKRKEEDGGGAENTGVADGGQRPASKKVICGTVLRLVQFAKYVI